MLAGRPFGSYVDELTSAVPDNAIKATDNGRKIFSTLYNHLFLETRSGCNCVATPICNLWYCTNAIRTLGDNWPNVYPCCCCHPFRLWATQLGLYNGNAECVGLPVLGD